MKKTSGIALNDLLAQAQAAVTQGDYRQAIEIHMQVLEALHKQDPQNAAAFREGPFSELLMAAAYQAMELANRNHYLQALDLVTYLQPYFGNAEQMVQALEGIKQRSIDRVLYTRSSPKATDILLCCAETELATLHAPLAAALQELGVLVAQEPFIVNTDQPEGSLTGRLAESDALVLLISPEFFSAPWPQTEILELLNLGGASAVPVIPIWHRIERPEAKAASEPLAKLLPFETDKQTVDEIAQALADIIRPDLASGALHKLMWSAILQGKTLDAAPPEFEMPVRHASLEEAQIARIRLIRAAFLDGNRQNMEAWVESFSRDLEPDTAIIEWERLARVFQDARSLQRQLRTNPEPVLNQMRPEGMTESNRSRMRASYQEFAAYPSDRLFLLIWFASQPMAGRLDLGFPPEHLGLVNFFFEGLHLSPEEADFETQAKQMQPRPGTIEVTDWAGAGEDFNISLLHSEEDRPWSKPWDVFISHASEDKAQLVRPLADALQEYGVKVWFDTFNLRPGLNLSQSIDAGIAGAEFGIVVLSPYFITKKWPLLEFDALSKRQAQGDRLIALWHNLPSDKRPDWTRSLDPEKALDTAELPLTALTMRILEWVRPDLARFIQRKLAYQALQERRARGEFKTVTKQYGELEIRDRLIDRLPPALVNRVDLVRAVLAEVNPHSLEYWLDGFMRDYRPEVNIADWERIAAMYQEAILAVDFLSKGTAAVSHADVYWMISQLTSPFVSLDEVLPLMHEKYPEKTVNTILAIISSPTVIEILA